MSIFKSFSSYFYFFTPPHIILLLLSSCLLTISTAIPVPSSVSSPFINSNSNQLRSRTQLPRYNNNNNYYGKNDDLISSPSSNEQDRFFDDNLVDSVAKGKCFVLERLCGNNEFTIMANLDNIIACITPVTIINVVCFSFKWS